MRLLFMCLFILLSSPAFALVAEPTCLDKSEPQGTMRYNFDSNLYEYFNCGWQTFLLSDTNNGSCTDDGAAAGAWRFSSAANTYEFCDGDEWRVITTTARAGSCTTKGAMQFFTGNSKYAVCTGSGWLNLDATEPLG